jgi:glycosyltransferase involved in cell wall biosynthesis
VRILQLHARYRHEAGEDTVVEAEAAMLRRGGHDVVQLHAPAPVGKVAAARLLAQSPWNLGAARAVERAVAEHAPDVAHVHNTWFSLSSSVFSPLSRARVPAVMTLHNYRLACVRRDLYRDGAPCTACLGRSPTAGVLHRCYQGSFVASTIAATELSVHRARNTLGQVSRFIAPTGFAAGLLTGAGVPAERLVVKPHFTDDPGGRNRPCSSAHDVLYVGRLAPGKGVEELLAAWTRADRRPLKLVVVGDGPLRAELERRPSRGVRFIGWEARPEVLERMRSARALAFPSTWYEPFGMVLIEALAAGLPIVGFDAGGARQIVPPDLRDLLVPVGDVDRLAGALSTLQDDALVDRLSSCARQRFEAEFTATRNLPLLEDVYRSVL